MSTCPRGSATRGLAFSSGAGNARNNVERLTAIVERAASRAPGRPTKAAAMVCNCRRNGTLAWAWGARAPCIRTAEAEGGCVPGVAVSVAVVDLGAGPRAVPAVEIVAWNGVYDCSARCTAGLDDMAHAGLAAASVWALLLPPITNHPVSVSAAAGAGSCPGSSRVGQRHLPSRSHVRRVVRLLVFARTTE